MNKTNLFLSLTLTLSKVSGLASLVFISGMSGVHAKLPVVHPTMPWSSNVRITQQTDNFLQIGQNQGRSGNWILNWQSFDISKGSRVQFVQPSATHIALNRIYQNSPSKILGSIDANGRIYLINQNGFTFGKNSSINVNSMVASSLALNIKNDSDFINGKLNISNLVNNALPAFDVDAFQYSYQDDVLKEVVDVVTDPASQISRQELRQKKGEIKIQDGYVTDTNGNFVLDKNEQKIPVQAKMQAAQGGSIMIIAANIENAGSISTKNGQVILAAAEDKVYLTPSQDPALRGFLVEVKTGGSIKNLGHILAERGNITLAGLSINQGGVLHATSSVNENGSIRLLARHGARSVSSGQIDSKKDKLILGIDLEAGGVARAEKYIVAGETGDVTLQKDSLTLVTIDTTDETVITDLQSMQASRVEIAGKNITIKAASTIIAQGGRVVNEDAKDVRSVVTGGEVVLHASGDALQTATTDTGDLRNNDNSKIIIESGSEIDVSGNSDAKIAMQRNELEVTLTGNFLRDAPLQREGALRNKTVILDIRDETPLGDISDLLASSIKRGIKELSAEGGSIEMISRGGILLEEKSELDITGGSISYLDGFINSSVFLTNTGNVIDIADADPNLLYSAVYGKLVVDSERWGKSARREWNIFGGKIGGRNRFYQGYTEGKDAGSVKIKTHAAIIDSTLIAGSINGIGQRVNISDALSQSTIKRSLGGELTIEMGSANDTLGQSIELSDSSVKDIKTQQDINDFFNSDMFNANEAATKWQLNLGNALMRESGISKLSLRTPGDVVVNETANLNLTSGGELKLSGRSVSIDNNIRIASGKVTATSTNGDLLVNGVIDTSGNWVNDLQYIEGRDLSRSVNLNGGSIKLSLTGTTGELLLADSVLKANGGAWFKATGKIRMGDGGNIKLAISNNNNNATNIELGEFEAYSAARGGSLSILANKISIANGFNKIADNKISDLGELQFDSDFFTRGGFSDYELISNANDISIANNTIISPTTESLVFNRDINTQQSTDNLFALTEVKKLEAYAAPTTNLSLIANQLGPNETANGLLVSESAIINMTAGSNVNLAAVNNLVMQGDIYTAGGNVSLSLNSAITGYSANAGIWLDGKIKTNGNLNEQGEFEINTLSKNISNDLGLITGRVLAAGDVNLNANSGYIISTKKSEINTSGSEYDLDLPIRAIDNTVVEYQRQKVSSDAGNINFTAAEGMYILGDLQAQAAQVDGASGGKLSVELNVGKRNSDPLKITSQGRAIHIRQLLDDLPDDFFVNKNTEMQIQNSIITDVNEAHIGKAWISVETIKNSGVDRLRLQSANIVNNGLTAQNTGAIIFEDNIDLQLSQSLELFSPIIRIQNSLSIDDISLQNKVNLAAAYVMAGSIENIAPHKDVVASSGNSSLNITAGLNGNEGLLEITGDVYFQGVANSNLFSEGDIRLRGVIQGEPSSKKLAGSLNAQSNMTLQADQVYSTTLSEFEISVSGDENAILKIEAGAELASEAAAVLSAGSVLSLSAPVIQHSGVIKAPQGQISFNASQKLVFGDDSITSVSAEGLVVPFGFTLGEERWIYPFENDNRYLNDISAAPAKNIFVKSDDIKISDSAVFDVSGGGDLSSWEFVPGLGGSFDTLLAENNNGAFAVIAANPAYAPYDFLNWQGVDNINMGNQVYLAGNSDLAAGLYTMLPARYALLPGAHLITPTGKAQLLSQQFRQLDGSPIVPGQFSVAGSGAHDNLWSGFVIETAARVRQRSEYFETTASQFLREDSLRNNAPLPVMPEDAGVLSILAGSALNLSGVLLGNAATVEFKQGKDVYRVQGMGSLLNISGNNLRVVSEIQNAENNLTNGESVIQIVDEQLNEFSADSILLGGVRTRDEQGVNISTSATDVTIAENVSLNLPELIIVARNNIKIEADAKIVAASSSDGVAPVMEPRINISGDGALLRVSSNEQVSINRSGESAKPLQGLITLAQGVEINASKSIVLDSSVDLVFKNESTLLKPKAQLKVNGGFLTLGSSNISIGDFSAINNIVGVKFTKAELEIMDVNNLVLSSRNSIDLYGSIELNLNSIELQSASINAYLNTDDIFSINAVETITLNNTSAYVTKNLSEATVGKLQLTSRNINLANGNINVSGVDEVDLIASENILLQGEGGIDFTNAKAVILDGRITTNSNANYEIDAKQAELLIQRGSTAELDFNDALGGKLKISAASLMHAGQIDMASGYLSLSSVAENSDLTLTEASGINLSGFERDFAGQVVYTPGGSLTLNSFQADIQINQGAVINLSSSGDAGKIKLTAINGNISLNGNLRATSGEGYRAGSFASQSLGFDDLALINQQLNTDFNARRYFQIGEGDINLGINKSIVAQDVLLQTDNGVINVLGTIDASGEMGGRVYLAAQKAGSLVTDVLINVAGSVYANAINSSNEGGDVFIESRGNGLIDITGNIDVAGGVGGAGGKIKIRTPRNAANDDLNLNDFVINNLSGYRRIDIEAYKTYSINNFIDVTKFSPGGEYASEASSFMQNATGIKNKLGLNATTITTTTAATQNKLHLRAGVELSSETDITLDRELDLQALKFSAEPGVLSLRAKQNIYLNASLQDGFIVSRKVHELQRGESWSLNLVSGADLNAVSINSILPDTQSTSFDIILADNTLLRTGTGDINIISAGHLTMGNNAAIYTGGQKGEELSLYQEIKGRRGSYRFIDNQILAGLEFPEKGGDIFIKVDGDLSAPQSSSLLVTDWLYRIGPNYTSSPVEGELPNMVGVGFAGFTNGIGALGGGDINIDAAGSISNLAVSIPSIEKYTGEVEVTLGGGRVLGYNLTSSQTDITGSGDIHVFAGNDIMQSLFFSANGEMNISAAGNIGNLTDDSGIYLVMGNTRANVFSAGDLSFQGVSTMNLLPYSQQQQGLLGNSVGLGQFANYYSNFGENSAVELTSLSGLIDIKNQAVNVFSSAAFGDASSSYDEVLTIYPGEFSATAIDGSLNIKSDISLYPSSNGGISLLAQNDIVAVNGSGINIKMFDVAPEDLPSKLNSVSKATALTAAVLYDRSNRLLHINDEVPSRFIANTGDIKATNKKLFFNIITNEQTELYAGRDILGIKLSIQNTAKNNISRVQAGRDIRHINGSQFGIEGVLNKIEINGPGELHVLAGRDINLGNQGGIVATANSVNPLLPSEGAKLIIMAGLGEQGANYNGFIAQYFTENSEYANSLLDFMQQQNPAVDDFQQALNEFRLLKEKQQRSLIVSAFSNELIQSATRAAKEQNASPDVDDGKLLGYSRGLDAIDILFPGTIQSKQPNNSPASNGEDVSGGDLIVTGGQRYLIPDTNAAYRGNISMVASTIQSQGEGADISILIPGGFMNVGLSVSNESKQVEKGIITKGNGNISLFTQGDISVNQSRVQSLNQGFISGWSTKGDVDAGKGEKSALVIPPPRTVIDPQTGAVTQVFDVAVQGNGIRSACSDVDCLTAVEFNEIAAQINDVEYLNSLKHPGDVTLAAPAGVIDAGDAGIRSGGNLILATDTVLNANQISVGGDSTGVPVGAGALGVDLGGLDVNSVGEDAASELVATDVSDQFGAGSIAILQVEVMGLSGDVDINSVPPVNQKNTPDSNMKKNIKNDAKRKVDKKSRVQVSNDLRLHSKNRASLTMNVRR